MEGFDFICESTVLAFAPDPHNQGIIDQTRDLFDELKRFQCGMTLSLGEAGHAGMISGPFWRAEPQAEPPEMDRRYAQVTADFLAGLEAVRRRVLQILTRIRNDCYTFAVLDNLTYFYYVILPRLQKLATVLHRRKYVSLGPGGISGFLAKGETLAGSVRIITPAIRDSANEKDAQTQAKLSAQFKRGFIILEAGEQPPETMDVETAGAIEKGKSSLLVGDAYAAQDAAREAGVLQAQSASWGTLGKALVLPVMATAAVTYGAFMLSGDSDLTLTESAITRFSDYIIQIHRETLPQPSQNPNMLMQAASIVRTAMQTSFSGFVAYAGIYLYCGQVVTGTSSMPRSMFAGLYGLASAVSYQLVPTSLNPMTTIDEFEKRRNGLKDAAAGGAFYGDAGRGDSITGIFAEAKNMMPAPAFAFTTALGAFANLSVLLPATAAYFLVYDSTVFTRRLAADFKRATAGDTSFRQTLTIPIEEYSIMTKSRAMGLALFSATTIKNVATTVVVGKAVLETSSALWYSAPEYWVFFSDQSAAVELVAIARSFIVRNTLRVLTLAKDIQIMQLSGNRILRTRVLSEAVTQRALPAADPSSLSFVSPPSQPESREGILDIVWDAVQAPYRLLQTLAEGGKGWIPLGTIESAETTEKIEKKAEEAEERPEAKPVAKPRAKKSLAEEVRVAEDISPETKERIEGIVSGNVDPQLQIDASAPVSTNPAFGMLRELQGQGTSLRISGARSKASFARDATVATLPVSSRRPAISGNVYFFPSLSNPYNRLSFNAATRELRFGNANDVSPEAHIAASIASQEFSDRTSYFRCDGVVAIDGNKVNILTGKDAELDGIDEFPLAPEDYVDVANFFFWSIICAAAKNFTTNFVRISLGNDTQRELYPRASAYTMIKVPTQAVRAIGDFIRDAEPPKRYIRSGKHETRSRYFHGKRHLRSQGRFAPLCAPATETSEGTPQFFTLHVVTFMQWCSQLAQPARDRDEVVASSPITRGHALSVSQVLAMLSVNSSS